MAQYKVKTNQNLFDVAIDLYGSIEGLFDLLISNPHLTMTTDLYAGMILEYHDYFIINNGIIKNIRDNEYIPSNGERHVYFKDPAYELIAVSGIVNDKEFSGFAAGGTGTLAIDWGDNSDLQTIILTATLQRYTHYFDNKVDNRRIKIYGECSLAQLDLSDIGGDTFLVRPLIVDEFISRSNGNSLKGLFLFEGTVKVDLRGMDISDLSAIGDMSLQELNLLNVRFTDVSVLDNYLQYIAGNYGNRRDCTVFLNTEPTETGMQAIQTIINEQSWNESGKWKFIINEQIYTKE